MECTKGELEIRVTPNFASFFFTLGKYDHHRICQKDDTGNIDILEDVPSAKAQANAAELVRRWNAFEDKSKEYDGRIKTDLINLLCVRDIEIKELQAAIAASKGNKCPQPAK